MKSSIGYYVVNWLTSCKEVKHLAGSDVLSSILLTTQSGHPNSTGFLVWQ